MTWPEQVAGLEVRYRKMLHALSFSRKGFFNDADREDAVSTVWMRLLQIDPKTFPAEEQAQERWLRAFAINTFGNLLYKDNLRRAAWPLSATNRSKAKREAIERVCVAQGTEQHPLTDDVRRAIETLPEEEQDLVHRLYYRCEAIGDIAKATGRDEKSLLLQHENALRHLHRALGQPGKEVATPDLKEIHKASPKRKFATHHNFRDEFHVLLPQPTFFRERAGNGFVFQHRRDDPDTARAAVEILNEERWGPLCRVAVEPFPKTRPVAQNKPPHKKLKRAIAILTMNPKITVVEFSRQIGLKAGFQLMKEARAEIAARQKKAA